MLTTPALRKFLGSERGSVALEVVVIFFPLMMIILMIFQVGVAFYFILAAQKAAQLGARFLAGRDSVYIGADMPMTNQINPLFGEKGDACYQADGNDACIDPGGPWTCRMDTTGSVSGSCDQSAFDAMVAEMKRVYPTSYLSDIVVVYQYEHLGYADGPFVPLITVTILRPPSPLQLITPIGNGEGISDSRHLYLRPVSASAFGEDLSSLN